MISLFWSMEVKKRRERWLELCSHLLLLRLNLAASSVSLIFVLYFSCWGTFGGCVQFVKARSPFIAPTPYPGHAYCGTHAPAGCDNPPSYFHARSSCGWLSALSSFSNLLFSVSWNASGCDGFSRFSRETARRMTFRADFQCGALKEGVVAWESV